MPSSVALYPGLKIDGGGIAFSYAESALRLRLFLTYFEEVALIPLGIPHPGMGLHFLCSDEFTALEGGLVKTISPRQVQIGPLEPGMFDHDCDAVFSTLNSIHPGRWSLATPPCSTWSNRSGRFPNLLMSLGKILPCPSGNVPIDEVIVFKTKNASRLRTLHDYIDHLFDCVSASDQSAADRVMRKILNEVESIDNYFRKQGYSPVKVDISIRRAVEAGAIFAATHLASMALGLNSVIADLLGAMAGTVSLSHTSSPFSVSSNSFPRDYEYIVETFYNYGNTSPFYVPVELTNDVENVIFSHNTYLSSIPRQRLPQSKLRDSAVVGNVYM